MSREQLTVEVVDRRLQVDMDEQEGDEKRNEFLEQGFEAKEEEEERDEEPEYHLSKLLPKQNQKERLIEQNIKLKTQIYELAKQLDQILTKDKAKKKNYGTGLPRLDQEEEPVRVRRLQLQKQQIAIQEMKGRIFIAKRQLECVYNNEVIQAKQDELKTLRGELKTLEEEKQGHLNIQKVQSKALKVVRNEQEYGEKMKNVMAECNHLRKESKILLQKIAVAERTLMKTHDSYVSKHQKIKELEQKLALNKQKGRNKKPSEQMITEDMIQGLEAEIKYLQAARKEGEKGWQQKIRVIDLELMNKRNEQEKKLLVLREKEKELRINELKIRELRKLARQMQDAPAEGKRTAQEMDMSQFRHKRNIRYMDK